MAEQELWTELLKQLQTRYQAVNEVFRITKEVADILSLMKGERQASGKASFEEKKIGEIGENIRRNLEKVLELDRIISVRLAGKDSFYKQP